MTIDVLVPQLPCSGVVVTSAWSWDADTAVSELYAAHWRSLVRLAVLLVRDQGTAEEVVQDAFVAMHGRWNRLREPEKALAYLRQSVVNRSRSVLRHRKVVDRHLLREAQSGEPVAPSAEHPTLQAETRDRVIAALAELPQRQREVLVLRYYLDLSEAQIADALGVSRGAVKSHASRGAAALRERLGGLWKEES
ncbi:SigE family RNA polymerase sigma factor [Nocardioides sp. Bht2]|uniref:SigE family RNA polymerase sigma factor n=1 Tax=Nocardioides sp. Bht2 TaxID=3392297 RepID=UPI0039B69E42